MHPELAFALELADVADELTLRSFRAPDLQVESKPDGTPVTPVDRAVEEALRARIAEARPEDGVLGEELEDVAAGAGRGLWVLDPVDGTRNYVRGVPVYATLIAFATGSGTSLGVVSAPALGRRWWAARGEGAFADGEPISVSSVRRLDDAYLSYDDVAGFAAAGLADRFAALADRCWHSRGLGDFWSHVLVAEGSVDVAVEPDVSLWDVAAVQVIVEEAGGRFTDLAGVARPDGGSAVSTNGHLHAEVLAALGV